MVRFRTIALAAVLSLLAAWIAARAGAQDFHHPTPWIAASALRCVATPTAMTRAELDAQLARTRSGSACCPSLSVTR